MGRSLRLRGQAYTADPAVWCAAAAVVLVVSIAANLVPAWRAAAVDPSRALRME